MYVAILSTEICVSIDDINKRVGEHRTRKVNIVVGCSADGYSHFRYVGRRLANIIGMLDVHRWHDVHCNWVSLSL
jgi:hypothetical protein